MKSSTLFFLAAGFVLWGSASCSSTTTETADPYVTTEPVTPIKAAPHLNEAADAGNLPDDPSNFIPLAGSLDLLETQSSNQVLAIVSNPEIRNFAQLVLSDHRKVLLELRGLASKKELKYPTVLLPKHQLMLNRLSEEKTKEFEKSYMELQEAALKELEELFEAASKRHSDPEMKAYATKNLPTIRQYLADTKKVKDKVD